MGRARHAGAGGLNYTFVVPLTGGWVSGFYFKLVGHGTDMKFGDFEPDNATRFWQPSDGPDIWVKSGEPDVQSEAMVPYAAVFPLTFGAPNLRIQDLVGDFDNTFYPADAAPTALDGVFATMRYAVTVYTSALYTVWWTSESRGLARAFRIPAGRHRRAQHRRERLRPLALCAAGLQRQHRPGDPFQPVDQL